MRPAFSYYGGKLDCFVGRKNIVRTPVKGGDDGGTVDA